MVGVALGVLYGVRRHTVYGVPLGMLLGLLVDIAPGLEAAGRCVRLVCVVCCPRKAKNVIDCCVCARGKVLDLAFCCCALCPCLQIRQRSLQAVISG